MRLAVLDRGHSIATKLLFILIRVVSGHRAPVITRLADTVEFEVGSPASFEAGAKHLLTRGYNA